MPGGITSSPWVTCLCLPINQPNISLAKPPRLHNSTAGCATSQYQEWTGEVLFENFIFLYSLVPETVLHHAGIPAEKKFPGARV